MSANPVIKITPTFRLGKIDPFKIQTLYASGHFSTAKIPESKAKITYNSSIMAPTYTSNTSDGIYTVVDRSGVATVIATHNQKSFEIFTKSGGKAPLVGKCDYCCKVWEEKDLSPQHTDMAQMPISHGYYSYDESKEKRIHIFWGDLLYCDYRCVYAKYLDIKRSSQCDTLYKDSGYLLQSLFNLQYPGQTLTPANDYRLLDINGGPLSYEQWKSKKYTYHRTHNIIQIPIKVEYIRNNCST